MPRPSIGVGGRMIPPRGPFSGIRGHFSELHCMRGGLVYNLQLS